MIGNALMAAAVAIKKPAPSRASALQTGKGPQQQRQQQKIGLAQQIDVVHQNDDARVTAGSRPAGDAVPRAYPPGIRKA